MEKQQILVIDANELGEIIPSCIVLNKTTFKDTKELLKKLISKIEETNEWEYVAYIQTKPSLFVIRSVKASVTTSSSEIESLKLKIESLEEKLSNIKFSSINKPLKESNLLTKESSVYDDNLFTEEVTSSITKLPWE